MPLSSLSRGKSCNAKSFSSLLSPSFLNLWWVFRTVLYSMCVRMKLGRVQPLPGIPGGPGSPGWGLPGSPLSPFGPLFPIGGQSRVGLAVPLKNLFILIIFTFFHLFFNDFNVLDWTLQKCPVGCFLSGKNVAIHLFYEYVAQLQQLHSALQPKIHWFRTCKFRPAVVPLKTDGHSGSHWGSSMEAFQESELI